MFSANTRSTRNYEAINRRNAIMPTLKKTKEALACRCYSSRYMRDILARILSLIKKDRKQMDLLVFDFVAVVNHL